MADEEGVGKARELLFDDPDKPEPRDLLASVVNKRKTIPTKCMKIYADCVRYEIKRLKNAKIILDECKDKQKFSKLMHKLRKSEPAEICLNDLQEAEKKVLRFHMKLKEINMYLKKRNQCLK